MNRAELIASVPYFRGMAASSLARLSAEAQELHFNPGQYLFAEGEPNKGLYAIAEGAVRLSRISAQGREHVLIVAVAGHTINEVSVIDGGMTPGSGH